MDDTTSGAGVQRRSALQFGSDSSFPGGFPGSFGEFPGAFGGSDSEGEGSGNEGPGDDGPEAPERCSEDNLTPVLTPALATCSAVAFGGNTEEECCASLEALASTSVSDTANCLCYPDVYYGVKDGLEELGLDLNLDDIVKGCNVQGLKLGTYGNKDDSDEPLCPPGPGGFPGSSGGFPGSFGEFPGGFPGDRPGNFPGGFPGGFPGDRPRNFTGGFPPRGVLPQQGF